MAKSYHFFALMGRMNLIRRWSLMRCTQPENVSEHTTQTAQLAHVLAVIRNRVFGGSVDASRAAVLALYHDSSEIFTGDLPTPVKYYNSHLSGAYHEMERSAEQKLLTMLPPELQPDYHSLFVHEEPDAELWKLVKAADKLSAHIKCLEELKAGNGEFQEAAASTRQALEEMELPEVSYFLEKFLPSFSLSLDEQNG